MSRWRSACMCLPIACLLLSAARSRAQDLPSPAELIDLPTALRLAGAQNLDVAIAHERLAEARAAVESAYEQFFPWLSPGASYRRHAGRIQDVQGAIIDTTKHAYASGAALTAQVDLGDAYFKALAARQVLRAADDALEAQRRNAVLAAAEGYFDLAEAQAAIGVEREAVRISEEYEGQLHRAVAIGIAFKGEELRVRVQTEHNRLGLRQAEERRRVASARLAVVLHLDVAVDLAARNGDLVPLSLQRDDVDVPTLVREAFASRPELKQGDALVAAARATKQGAAFGPVMPTAGAQAFAGGLGGGIDGDSGHFGHSEDYAAGLNWRIGPGGLLDFGRIHAAESQLRTSELIMEKLKDDITRQVVEADARVHSFADQLATTKDALGAAEEGLRLTQQRKEFAVGNVLETIQAEQELTRTRNDYLAAVAAYDKAQYARQHAIGAGE